MLCGRRLFRSETEGETVAMVMGAEIKRPSEIRPELAPLDGVVLNGLARNQRERFQTARDMARELEKAVKIASPLEVGEWVESLIGDELTALSDRIGRLEKEKGRRLTPSPDAVDPEERSSVVTRRERPLPSDPLLPDTEATHEDMPREEAPAPEIIAPKKTSRRGLSIGIALLFGASILGLAVIAKVSARSSPEAPIPVASASAIAEAPSNETAVAPSDTPADSSTSASIAVSALPHSVAPPSHTHHANAHDAQPSASATAPALPAPTLSSVPDCSEPKYVGDDGHIHFKPECYRSIPPTP
jgi:hypothetical protein